MNRFSKLLFAIFALLVSAPAFAEERVYTLTVEKLTVNITGSEVEKITVNGGIPAPELRFREGEEAVIHVINKMDEDTSIHWHGLLLPGIMDGVPGLNGFHGIKPGETYTYRFKLRQSGTYWYHAHSMGQEQDGLYGSMVIEPRAKDKIKADRDHIVLLSDFSMESSDQILSNLKMDSDYYANARRTVSDFVDDSEKRGFDKAWKDAKDWGHMRMARTDLADVTGYTFLVNGKTPEQNWTGLFKVGEQVRLRFINASAMTIFDLRIPGLKLQVVQADGQDVEPVTVDEFRIGPAETYDVVVTPQKDSAYTIAAEPIDRSGFAIGTLATRQGERGEIPEQRPRALLKMGDMAGMDMGDMEMSPADMKSGWVEAGTPKGHKALSYADLRYKGSQKDTRQPDRTIEMRLGGNMERYIWTLNGKKYSEAKPIMLNYGERLRLNFTNETMMAHPMHLHGCLFSLKMASQPRSFLISTQL